MIAVLNGFVVLASRPMSKGDTGFIAFVVYGVRPLFEGSLNETQLR